jgi:hypothetical protein
MNRSKLKYDYEKLKKKIPKSNLGEIYDLGQNK